MILPHSLFLYISDQYNKPNAQTQQRTIWQVAVAAVIVFENKRKWTKKKKKNENGSTRHAWLAVATTTTATAAVWGPFHSHDDDVKSKRALVPFWANCKWESSFLLYLTVISARRRQQTSNSVQFIGFCIELDDGRTKAQFFLYRCVVVHLDHHFLLVPLKFSLAFHCVRVSCHCRSLIAYCS